jgi:hypothetical protein
VPLISRVEKGYKVERIHEREFHDFRFGAPYR